MSKPPFMPIKTAKWLDAVLWNLLLASALVAFAFVCLLLSEAFRLMFNFIYRLF